MSTRLNRSSVIQRYKSQAAAIAWGMVSFVLLHLMHTAEVPYSGHGHAQRPHLALNYEVPGSIQIANYVTTTQYREYQRHQYDR